MATGCRVIHGVIAGSLLKVFFRIVYIAVILLSGRGAAPIIYLDVSFNEKVNIFYQ